MTSVPVLDEIAGFLSATKTRLSAGSRIVLEAFLYLAMATGEPRVQGEILRDELGRRQNKTPDPAGLRQRLKRVNDALSKAEATFQLKSSGGDVIAQATRQLDITRHLDKVQAALSDMSDDATRLDIGGLVQPFAAPEKQALWVFFSYAWLNSEEHVVQTEFYDRLAEKLAYPPEEFADLPKLMLWRDVHEVQATQQGNSQIDAACERAFLGVLMISDKYSHSLNCKREIDFFLTDDGANRGDKSSVLVSVNVAHQDIPKRFTANTRIVMSGPNGENLIALWSRGSTADRLEFVNRVARQVFLAAQKANGKRIISREQLTALTENRTGSSSSAPPIEQFFHSRKIIHLDEMISPQAREGKISPEITTSFRATARPHGVPIVEHLISWATGRARSAPRLIALLGEFGMGKTVTCQLFTQKLLDLRRENPTLLLPIYFDLREIDRIDEGRGDLESLINQLLSKAGTVAPSAREVITFARERGAIIIFDGLDEVTNKLSPEEAIKLYRQLLAIVPSELWAHDRLYRRRARQNKTESDERKKSRRSNARIAESVIEEMSGPRVIVSCRTHYFKDVAAQRGFLTGMERSQAEADADIAAFFMLPFTNTQIESYLKLHLGARDTARAIELIDQTYNLRELATRPILLQFIRETFGQLEQEKLAGRTINLARLYDILVDQVFARDNPKHVIPPREKKLILRELVLHLHARGENEIDNDKLDQWFQSYAPTVPRLSNALRGAGGLTLSEIFAQDLRNASMLVRPGARAFQFAHTSIREYFLASALHAAACEGRGESAWDIAVPSPETLTFLLQRQAIEDPPEQRAFVQSVALLLEPNRSLAVRRLAFALWRRAYDTDTPLLRPERIDLSGFDLTQNKLSGVASRLLPLQNSLWRGAELHQTEFEYVDLSNANFAGADAPMSRWLSCQFEGTVFGNADLTGSIWRHCQLPLGVLTGAQLESARAVDCSMGEQKWRPQPQMSTQATWWTKASSFRTNRCVVVSSHAKKSIIVSGNTDRSIRVFDFHSGNQLAKLEGHRGAVNSVAVASLDGKTIIVSGSDDNTIGIFDLASSDLLTKIEGHTGWVRSVVVAERNGIPVVVSGSDDTTVRVFDLASGKQLLKIEEHKDTVRSVAVAIRDGKPVIISASDDTTIRVFDLASGKQIIKIDDHRGYVVSVAIAIHNGKSFIVSGSDDTTVRVFDLASGKQLIKTKAHKDWVRTVAVGVRNGRTVIISGSDDNAICVFDLITGEQITKIGRHRGSVKSVAVGMRSGKVVIVSGSDDETIGISDLNSGKQIGKIEGRGYAVRKVALAVEQGIHIVISASDRDTICVFDLISGRQLANINGHKGSIKNMTVATHNGKSVIVTGSEEGAIQVFDSISGANIGSVIKGRADWLNCAALAVRNGKLAILFACGDGIIRIFDLSSGGLLAQLNAHQGPITAVTVTTLDGKLVIVSGGVDGTIRLFDFVSGIQLSKYEGRCGRITALGTGVKEGMPIVVSGGDDAICVLELMSGKQLTKIEGHNNWFRSVAVAALGDNLIVVSVGVDSTIRLFDLISGGHLGTIDGQRFGPNVPVVTVANGMVFAVSYGDDGTICIFELDQNSFRMRQKLCIVHATGSFIRIGSGGSQGETLLEASPHAWRDFGVECRTPGNACFTDIDDMPRSVPA